MVEEVKKKKSRKQRKVKGSKRKPTYIGAFREKEGRPTTKMEVLASGSSGLTGANLGKKNTSCRFNRFNEFTTNG